MKGVTFSVNEYDCDGDIVEEGIFLNFGDARILVAKNLEDYKEFCKTVSDMTDEISDFID